MKTLYFSFLLLFTLLFTGCEDLNDVNISEDCIADITVTSLDIVGAVTLGQDLNWRCVIKNIVNTTASCTASGAGTATVSCAFKSDLQDGDTFADFEVFDKQVVDLASFDANDVQTDSNMPMPTNQGPGYYAMKVELDAPNDVDASNDSKAVTIPVN